MEELNSYEYSEEYTMPHSTSDLQVITYAKNLCSYIMTITQKSPKQFRFSLVGRMQGYALDIVQELYFANDIYVTVRSRAGWQTRRDHQRRAMSTLKLLAYVSQLSMEQGAIQPKQFEQISQQVSDVQNLLGAWLISDQKRMKGILQGTRENTAWTAPFMSVFTRKNRKWCLHY